VCAGEEGALERVRAASCVEVPIRHESLPHFALAVYDFSLHQVGVYDALATTLTTDHELFLVELGQGLCALRGGDVTPMEVVDMSRVIKKQKNYKDCGVLAGMYLYAFRAGRRVAAVDPAKAAGPFAVMRCSRDSYAYVDRNRVGH
jgi:Ulp1 family protease